MKFLPHFPLLMIILFKVYQLENVLCNLNSNDSNKCVWGGKKTPQYCELLLLFFLSLEMSSCPPHSGARHCLRTASDDPLTPVRAATLVILF